MTFEYQLIILLLIVISVFLFFLCFRAVYSYLAKDDGIGDASRKQQDTEERKPKTASVIETDKNEGKTAGEVPVSNWISDVIPDVDTDSRKS